MSKTRIRAVWGTAQSEYIKWICSSRMLIFLCALIFIDQFAVKPLVEISKQTGVKLGLFEPFIAITNSDVLLMIMPIVFITLIGDFPKNDGNMLFCVQRTWRVNWLLGQMLFLVMSSLTFMLLVPEAFACILYITVKIIVYSNMKIIVVRTKVPDSPRPFSPRSCRICRADTAKRAAGPA